MTHLKLLFSLLFVLMASVIMAQQTELTDSTYDAVDTLDQDFGLFTHDDVFRIALRFDISEYTRKKPKDEYLPAVLTYYLTDKDSINKDIRLKCRGEFRSENCSFPPIRLNFKNAGMLKEDLKALEKVKMVTHCSAGNETILFKEYLIYKMYNLLTDYSFKVRLMQVDYINTHRKNKVYKSYAFFIEPIEWLAKRTNTIAVESNKLTQADIIPEMMDRMSIFNYLVGNTDWAVPNQHNCKVLISKEFTGDNKAIIVPYDFDYSGLVNASYAIPSELLGIENVRQRLFLGLCHSKEEYESMVQELVDQKASFYQIINDFQYLSKREKSIMTDYLDEFFNNIDTKHNVVETLLLECKNL